MRSSNIESKKFQLYSPSLLKTTSKFKQCHDRKNIKAAEEIGGAVIK